MTKLKYNLNEVIVLEIDITEIDNEILSVWWRAFNTECKIRSRDESHSSSKTILHMSGVYICLGLWDIIEVKRWWKELDNERGKRMYVKHEKIFDSLKPGETEAEQIRRLETEYSIDLTIKEQAEQMFNKTIHDDITNGNEKCGMIYQSETSSHGTLDSPYNTSNTDNRTRMSYLNLNNPSTPTYRTNTVVSEEDKLSEDSLSSLEYDSNQESKRTLWRDMQNFRLTSDITSTLQDSMTDIFRQCERYMKEGIYKLPNGKAIYNPKIYNLNYSSQSTSNGLDEDSSRTLLSSFPDNESSCE